MKIRTKKINYEKAVQKKRHSHKNPKKQSWILKKIIRVISVFDLWPTHFKYKTYRMEEMGKGPWLVMMNHSSFIDLEIAFKILRSKPFNIICTSDGFVGKEGLMRSLGCVPTQKFVTDTSLITDMRYSLNKLKQSILLYPEASYSFDGCATPLPRKMGLLLKRLNVPVVSIITHGAFARDPLYNCLQKRKVNLTAEVRGLLTPEEIKEKSVDEIDAILDEAFSFDNFAWQKENKIEITENFRADGLERILYKCACCGVEGEMEGKGINLTCNACGKKYELTTLGELKALEGETEFSHIPNWYNWERQQVKKELEDDSYSLDIDVNIGMLIDFKSIYMVGEGRLKHSTEGFELEGCNGKLSYHQRADACYSLYSDYFWYEIGDVVCIGNNDVLYYCFPKDKTPVAKTRLAVEELYKIKKSERKRRTKE